MIKKLGRLEDFERETKDKVIVDFYADWCGPCRILSSNMESIKDEINVLKVNVDEYEELAIKYNITAIPAIYLFENNKEIKHNIGLMETDKILEFYKN